MLEYNEITERKYIVYEGAPYEVLTSHVFRKQQRKPVNATKLKNLITGKVTEVSFHQSEKIDEAEINKKEIKYLYTNRNEWWFADPKDPSKRFPLKDALVGPAGKFLKANTIVDMLTFGEDENVQILGLKLPIKVELKVTEAAPAVRGDTISGGSKQITLETGAVINAPLFIKEGDIVKINTDTSEYSERAN